MGKIKIIQAGALSSIQDLGRTGYQKYGVQVGGAMDCNSLKHANWLVGNKLNEACIECTFTGPTVEVLSDTIIAVTGAIIPFYINGKIQKQNKTHHVKSGDIISFGNIQKGLRFYIAFAGGFQIDELMGSKSTNLRAGFGGFCGRKLQAENILNINDHTISNTFKRVLPERFYPFFTNNAEIRILAGPEVKQFTLEGIKNFLTEEYTISPESDRMGYRLTGSKITHKKSADIISSAIPLGTVQVPGDGQPIIMMADRQTIGGYTRIAFVISSDIPILAQLMPGSKIRFKEIKLDEAMKLYQATNKTSIF